MTDKNNSPSIDIVLADAMLRIASLEKILIDKNIITLEELAATTEEIATKVTKVILEKAQSTKSVEEFVNDLKGLQNKKNFDN